MVGRHVVENHQIRPRIKKKEGERSEKERLLDAYGVGGNGGG